MSYSTSLSLSVDVAFEAQDVIIGNAVFNIETGSNFHIERLLNRRLRESKNIVQLGCLPVVHCCKGK